MNVPKLRFKEFTDEWKNKQLLELAEIIDGDRGKNYPKENELYGEEYCLFLNAGNVTKHGFDFSNNLFITKEKDVLLRNGKLSRNDIVLTTRGTVGNVAFYDQGIPYDNIRINSSMVIVRSNNYIKSKYLYSFINSPKFDLQIKRAIFGSAQPQLTIKGLSKFLVSYSSYDEQIKVASFLLLLDKKIELQSKKIEDLKLYKLYIKSRVFNESDMLRYKLNNLCCCKASNINLLDIEFDNGKFPIYGATGEIKKISTFQFSDNYIAIVKDGASVGKTIICDGNSSIIATMNAIIPNKIPIYYFNELIKNINFSKYIVGSGIPHIYFKDYSMETVKIHNRPRMKLIDSIFNDLSRKIVYEEDKLKKLFQLKKGFMQKMFA